MVTNLIIKVIISKNKNIFLFLFLCANIILNISCLAYINNTPNNSINKQEAKTLAGLRNQYVTTEKLILSGKIKSEGQIPPSLQTYSLYPYLELELIKDHLKYNPIDKISNFYTKYPNSPMAKTLNHYWVNYLAKNHRWPEIITYYQPNTATNLQCLYTTAIERTTPEKITPADVNNLWLVGSDRPNECNSLFNLWVKQGRINKDLVWERIYLGIDNNNPELVKSLGNYLSVEDREDIKLWIRVNKNINLIKNTNLFNKYIPFHHKILTYGLKKIANKNIAESLRYYRELNYKFNFSDPDKYDYFKYIAMKMFINDHDKTEVLLSEIPLEYYDEALHTVAIKSALKTANWELVVKRIEQLPDNLKQEDIWIYWLARAYGELKNEDTSRNLYSQISNKTNYYGLLACNNTKQLCPIEFAITQPYKEDKISLLKNPGISRAIEFYKLKRFMQARLEWNTVTRTLTEKQKFIAANIASELNWHDRNIIIPPPSEISQISDSSQSIEQNTDKLDPNAFLHLKYPLGYQQSILKYSKKYNIDPAWVFAISRQESAFIIDAKSSAGALGVMQLMPATAQKLAKNNKIPYRNKSNLLNETTNINLGSAYLQKMLHDNHNNPVLATAAYNAGPGRVKKWVNKDTKPIATDIWIELVPYYETRNYLKRVLTNTAIYRSRLGKSPTLLSEVMPVTMEAANK